VFARNAGDAGQKYGEASAALDSITANCKVWCRVQLLDKLSSVASAHSLWRAGIEWRARGCLSRCLFRPRKAIFGLNELQVAAKAAR
jgi:hypothetical protein